MGIDKVDDPFESLGAAVLALLEEMKLTKYNMILSKTQEGPASDSQAQPAPTKWAPSTHKA